MLGLQVYMQQQRQSSLSKTGRAFPKEPLAWLYKKAMAGESQESARAVLCHLVETSFPANHYGKSCSFTNPDPLIY
jgi:hypothetical protein